MTIDTPSNQPPTDCPTVSIGLPVFNGGPYLELAIESVLAQTFKDWELIISDNASTDSTEETGRRYADADERITYIRQPENLGAGPNFKACFEPARGRYFCWLSADDLMGPEFIEKTVALLDDNPDAVVAYSETELVSSEGSSLGIYNSGGSDIRRADTDRIVRYKDLLVGYPAIVIFGLMRRDLLASTPVMGSTVGGDRIIVSEMGLHGRFLQVPEVQYFRRIHEDQYSWKATTANERRVWFGGSSAKGGMLTEFRRFGDHIESLRRVPMSRTERRRCWTALIFSFGPHIIKAQIGLTLRNVLRRIGRLAGRDIDLYRWLQKRSGIEHS